MTSRSIPELLRDSAANWTDTEVFAVVTWLCRTRGDFMILTASNGIRSVVKNDWPSRFMRPDPETVQDWAQDTVADTTGWLSTRSRETGRYGIASWKPSENWLSDQPGVAEERPFESWIGFIMFREGCHRSQREIRERIKRERAQREVPATVKPDDLSSKHLAGLIKKWIDRAGLTPQEREAIDVMVFAELSAEDAGAKSQWRCTGATMRARLHRAITRIRRVADKRDL